MTGAAVRNLILILVSLLVLVVLFFVLRPDSTESEAATAEPNEEVFDIAIAEGAMTPDEIAVDEGDRVELRVSSDSPLELHLHGYDLEEEVEPGEPAELAFDATLTGRFEIENHSSQEELGVLLVQPG